MDDFSQPLVGISAFQVAKLRESPQQLTFSQNYQSVLVAMAVVSEERNPKTS
jgi:hypothetical protein